MSDPNTNNATPEARPGFPFITVGAAVVVMFAFLFLMWLAASKDNPLAEPKAATDKAEPAPKVKLDEVQARNAAALRGVGAKMSRDEAHGKLLATLKGPNDKLPFPKPEPKLPKREDKKDEKGKGDEP